MEDVINKLTENGQYANELCLMFIVTNEEIYLKYLDTIDIRGKDLETFAYKCCHDADIEYMKETLLCISFGLFDLEIVYENLKRKNPLPFIDELNKPSDTRVRRYMRYKKEFDKKFNNRSR